MERDAAKSVRATVEQDRDRRAREHDAFGVGIERCEALHQRREQDRVAEQQVMRDQQAADGSIVARRARQTRRECAQRGLDADRESTQGVDRRRSSAVAL